MKTNSRLSGKEIGRDKLAVVGRVRSIVVSPDPRLVLQAGENYLLSISESTYDNHLLVLISGQYVGCSTCLRATYTVRNVLKSQVILGVYGSCTESEILPGACFW
jgi:hypothetical protein